MKAIPLIIMLASVSFAQDQTVTIEATPKPIVAPICLDKAKEPIPECDPLTPDAAPILIERAIGRKAGQRSYMIHVATPDEKKTEFQKEAWYMYQDGVQHPSFLQRASDPFTNWFKEKRIFGSPDVSLVYLYWVRASNDACTVFKLAWEQLQKDAGLLKEADKGDPSTLNTDPIDKCKLPVTAIKPGDDANRRAAFLERRAADVADKLVNHKLFGGETNVATEGYALVDGSGATLVKVSNGPLADFAATEHTRDMVSAITYKIAISKKIPTPLANLRDIIGMVVSAQAGETPVSITLPYTAVAGGQNFQVNYLPSDMVVSVMATETTDGGNQQKELSKNTWDNERRYPIDFSLALPLASYKEATVDVNNGNITAREVKKQKLAAMFDFSPWEIFDRKAGFETKKIAMQLLPVVMVGIPIAGKPLQHPILAGGIGISKAHFFFGTQFNRKATASVSPVTGNADSSTVTLPPGTVTQHWGTQFIWGIDLSVRTVTDLLKKKQ
jgi:hypothetical protein